MTSRDDLPPVARRLLAAAARLVPADARADWRREWHAECAWLIHGTGPGSGRRRATHLELVGRCAGAMVHALWLRWDRWRPEMWTYDLRIAARTLRRQPTFLALTVLTLGIGIGSTVAVFGAVRAVMLRPLPFPDADRLVSIATTDRGGPPQGAASSPPDVVDWAREQRTLSGVAAFSADALAVSGPGGPPEQVPGAAVTGAFFAVLGADAARGRTLRDDDAVAGAAPVVVIADALWTRRFARTPEVVGTSVIVDGVSRTVVGVLPPGVTYPLGAEAWVPLTFTADDLATQRGAQYLDVIGRLGPDASVAAAEADLGAIAARLAAAYPRSNDGRGVRVRSLRTAIVGDAGVGLLLLLTAAVLVLLVVCANVAGLLLTRALGSTRTLAIRAALGASGGRLARGALIESGILATLGGLVGVGLAWAVSRRIATLDDTLRIPLLDETRLDPAVCAVAVAATAVSAVCFGVAPAWRSAQLGEVAARARMALRPRTRSRAVLVVAEIALALVLVVGASTLVRSFVRLMAVDLGFDTSERVQTFAVSLPDVRYDTPARRAQFIARLLDSVRGAPGVDRAGAVFGLPLTGFGYVISLTELDGVRVPTSGPDELLLNVRVVTPDYLQAIGLPLRRGRAIDDRDGFDSPPVLLVNEAAARRLWPDREAIGRALVVGSRLGRDDRRVGGRVVGVVGDSHERGPGAPPRPTIYAAHAQFPASFMAVAMRTTPGVPVAASELQERLAALDPDVPMFRVRTMAQLAASVVAQPRLLTLLMSVFALAALAVAAIGVYGVLALAVEARRKEIGIRRAVGAGVVDVVRLVAGDTSRLLVAGVACGVVGTFAAQAALRRLTPDAASPDAGVYAVAVAVFAAVGAVAAWVPCRRALAVDPAATLKAE